MPIPDALEQEDPPPNKTWYATVGRLIDGDNDRNAAVSASSFEPAPRTEAGTSDSRVMNATTRF